jgi:hypothetical protein
LDVLSYTRWNRRKTADLLKISYKALLNKIKDYKIEDRYRELVRGQKSEIRDQRSEVGSQVAAGSGQPRDYARDRLAAGSRYDS